VEYVTENLDRLLCRSPPGLVFPSLCCNAH